jgi:PST family polysaccharide transporter
MKQAERFAQICARTTAARKNLKGKSVRGAVFLAMGGGIDFILRLASTVIMARLLSPEDFGLVAMVLAVTVIAEQFRDLGLSMATIQSQEISHEQVTNLFWVNTAAGALFGLAICGAAPLIAGFYGDQRLIPITFAISTNFLWGGLTVQHQALLSRQMKQAHMATIRLSASLISLALAVFLAIHNFGYWALAWREVARIFLVAAGMWVCCGWIPGLPSSKGEIGRLLRFGSDLTLTQFVIASVSSLDRLLIGRFFGAGLVGMYRQAQQLIMAPIEQLNAPIYSVSQPGLSMLHADPCRYRRYYQRILLVFSLATMPLGLFSAIYAHEITFVVLGSKWAGAAIFLRIFGLATFLRPTLETSSLVLVTCALSQRLLLIALIENAVLAILMLTGIRLGALGVASAYLSTMIVLLFPKLYYSFLGTPVSLGVFFKAISAPLIASGAMAGVLLVFRGFGAGQGYTISLIWGCGVAATVYAIILLMLPRGRNELTALYSDVLSSLQRGRSTSGEEELIPAQ